MEAFPGDNLERVLAEFARRHDAVARAEQQMREFSVTVTSRDGVVEATVSADAWASAVRFLGNRFKEMSGPELAGSVMAALTTARAEAATRVAAIVLSAEAHTPGSPAPSSAADPVPRRTGARAQPHACWYRVVREARAMTDRHVAAVEQSAARCRGRRPDSRRVVTAGGPMPASSRAPAPPTWLDRVPRGRCGAEGIPPGPLR